MTVDSPVRTTPTKTRRSPAHRRLRLLQVLILAVGLTVAARLVWIQTAQSSDLALKAQAIQTDLVDLPAARGDIVDRNGNLLAGNRTTFQVSADETVSQAALQRLSQMSSVPVADLQARLLVCGQPGTARYLLPRSAGEPIPVLSDVSIPIALSIDDAGLPGISVSRAAVRDYPSKANAAHLLGYLREGAGQSGLEAQYDLMLQGEPGQAVRELNREGSHSAVRPSSRLQGRRWSPLWTSRHRRWPSGLCAKRSPEPGGRATKPLVDRWSSWMRATVRSGRWPPTRPMTRTSGRRAVRGRIRGSDR